MECERVWDCTDILHAFRHFEALKKAVADFQSRHRCFESAIELECKVTSFDIFQPCILQQQSVIVKYSQ